VRDGPRPLTEPLVNAWAGDLQDSPVHLQHLIRDRGISRKTIMAYQIGYDGSRITIPVRVNGELVNVRRYKFDAGPDEPKMINLDGWGSPTRLMFADDIPDMLGTGARDSFVLYCGGEWDALSAIQDGYYAVCGTSGEDSVPDNLDRLIGKPVMVCLDTDGAGRKCAQKVLVALNNVSPIRKDVVLPLDKDLNDWYAKHGKTGADLRRVIRDTPRWGQRAPLERLLVLAMADSEEHGGSRHFAMRHLANQMADNGYSEEEIVAGIKELLQDEQYADKEEKAPSEPKRYAKDALSKARRRPHGKGPGGVVHAYQYTLDDMGNGQRLIDRHGTNMRYVTEYRKDERWVIWNGRQWVRDKAGQTREWGKDIVTSMRYEAMEVNDDDRKKLLLRHSSASASAPKISHMLLSASTEPGMAIEPSTFDRDPWLINCMNGTINLRVGRYDLVPHDKNNMCMGIIPLDFDEDAKCPAWDAFLERIQPDPEIRDFLQRAVGYSLTGFISEQVLFLMYGKGATGKSTFGETLLKMFGTYGGVMSFNTLLSKPRSAGGPDPDLVALEGTRFVLASESNEGDSYDEQRIKSLTGEDTLSARGLYEGSRELQMQCAIWPRTNHPPIVKGTDDAIWRRMVVVPFSIEISENERDLDLRHKLSDELPGILAWAVRGCLGWQWEGLRIPKALTAATKEYRRDVDLTADFLDDCCKVSPNASVGKRQLYRAYQQWAREEQGISGLAEKNIRRDLIARGFKFGRPTHKKPGQWYGLKLKKSIVNDTSTGGKIKYG
jgi:P4 family phage/plasmid primase-like protien